MKKTISILLVLCMMLTILPTALASWACTNCDDGGIFAYCPDCNDYMCDRCGKCNSCGYDKPHNMTVKYGVDESYIVTVPDSARIDAEGLGNINVSISDAMLASNANLKVYVTGDSYTNNFWHLTSSDNAANKLQYTISKNSVALGNNDEVLSVAAGQAWNSTVTAMLQLQLETEVSQAGTYSDTLTFVVDYHKEFNMQLNEYGFYYEQPYFTVMSIDGALAEMDMVFYPDGYVIGWAYGEAELVEATTYTIEDNQIVIHDMHLTIENNGNALSDGDVTYTLTPVVPANDIYGTFTSHTMGVDVVCDDTNFTMYQNGTYVDSIPRNLITWDKGIIYLNDEVYGFYYPDATMFAMTMDASETGASGMLFIKEQTKSIPAGAYTFNPNATVDAYIKVPSALEQSMLECQSNWYSADAQALCASISNRYGFDIIPLMIGENTVIDRITVGLSTNDVITDCMDTTTAGNIVMRVRNGNQTEYQFVSILNLIRFGIVTFSVEECEMPKEVADVFTNEFVRWNNEATTLQIALSMHADELSYVFFVEGMTWNDWYQNGYVHLAYPPNFFSPAYVVENGYVYLRDGRQVYYENQPVLATDEIIPNAIYQLLTTFTIDGHVVQTLCETWSEALQNGVLDNRVSNEVLGEYVFEHQYLGDEQTPYRTIVTHNGRTGYLAWDNGNASAYVSHYIPMQNAELTIAWNS